MLSDNDNGRDDEIMDQVDSETLEIMKPTQLNRTNVVKPALKVPKTVIMYNCKMRNFHDLVFYFVLSADTEVVI